MAKKIIFKGSIWNVLLMVCLVVSLDGCTPLRKKFTRTKKKDKTSLKFQPVLEPIDYANKEETVMDKYKLIYSQWQFLSRDFVQALEGRDTNDKNEMFLLSQMVEKLTKMKHMIPEEKADIFDREIDLLNKVLKTYKKPIAIRNVKGIILKLQRHSSRVKKMINPKYIFSE